MSDTQFNQHKRPTWWARIKTRNPAEFPEADFDSVFLKIKYVTADRLLDVICECEPGTTVFIGAGKGNGQVRETVITVEL